MRLLAPHADRPSTRRRVGAVRRLPSGRWQARYVNAAGHRVLGPHTFATEAEADAWLDAVPVEQLSMRRFGGGGVRGRREKRAEVVYVMRRDELAKIGLTTDADTRAKVCEAELVAVWDGNREIERALHYVFRWHNREAVAAFRGWQSPSEWFDAEPVMRFVSTEDLPLPYTGLEANPLWWQAAFDICLRADARVYESRRMVAMRP